MIGPPPMSLTDEEIARLEIVTLPGPEDLESVAVYRLPDTDELLAEDEETAAAIRQAFPGRKIRMV